MQVIINIPQTFINYCYRIGVIHDGPIRSLFAQFLDHSFEDMALNNITESYDAFFHHQQEGQQDSQQVCFPF